MKKETKKIIAAGIVMALSCATWGSVQAQECVTADGTSVTITDSNVTFDKKDITSGSIKTSIYTKSNGQVDIKNNDKITF